MRRSEANFPLGPTPPKAARARLDWSAAELASHKLRARERAAAKQRMAKRGSAARFDDCVGRLRRWALAGEAGRIEHLVQAVEARSRGLPELREWMERGGWRFAALNWAASCSDDALAGRCLAAVGALGRFGEVELAEAAAAAADQGRGPRVLAAFEELGLDWGPSSLAASLGTVARADTAKWLMARGAPVDGPRDADASCGAMSDGCFRRTPLMRQCLRGNFNDSQVAMLLMAMGADIHAVDSYGMDAAMFAAAHGRADIFMELARRGSDLERLDLHGRSCLEHACGRSGPRGDPALAKWISGRREAMAAAAGIDLQTQLPDANDSGKMPTLRI